MEIRGSKEKSREADGNKCGERLDSFFSLTSKTFQINSLKEKEIMQTADNAPMNSC